ncbi:DUF817 domain-containing protein [Paracoccus laeviglucosivorans]|uniref:Uncharacterized membrane protein YoaT, DUF817 family n=1 Tax=Paracoccus laeviglucosivorans TaxID=1197861 RepID=A0A521AAC4_9RHOB|nr:DUF817 domain-containing protein [Paracoccus laeviglucosivorans]SMO31743.1 Uncharacterized membrane protein YoaT, DUF817 family [Paracoccus laeviglucosivorans]
MPPSARGSTRALERRLGDWARKRVPRPIVDLVLFVLKQGWACLFGALMLAAIMLSHRLWQPDWPIRRYDALFVFAISTQTLFLILRLETWAEARVIALFHLTGTAMEIFKIHAGSWSYPEPGIMKLMGVPLFSGFMYASVGSYMARVIRIFDMRFTPYPPFWLTVLLAVLIYCNFFAHHFLPDIRLALFAATVIIYGRTMIWFRPGRWYAMPLPLAAFLTSLFLWIAENVGTSTGTWLYAGQMTLDHVSFSKIGSWYLLLYVSFVTVTLASRRGIGLDKPALQHDPDGQRGQHQQPQHDARGPADKTAL